MIPEKIRNINPLSKGKNIQIFVKKKMKKRLSLKE